MGIFSETAPGLWAAGLPVIPLLPRSKSPTTQGWSRYAKEDIPEDVKQDWLFRYADGNIGLPMGEKSGLVALDMDTDDQNIINLVSKLLPPSPWERIGKKGFVRLYRWKGHKTARIRTAEGKSLLEILSGGTQIVLPPSIHPDTQKPYVANERLQDVLATIPYLPLQAEILIRQALIEEGVQLSTKGFTKVTEYISMGARDSKMTSMAGLLAKGVTRGERSLAETVGEMRTWVDNFVEKVAGDEMDAEKAVQKVLEFLKRDIVEGKKVLPTGWDDDLTIEEREKLVKELGITIEQWSAEKAMKHIEEVFTAHDRVDGMSQRRDAVEKVVEQIAISDKITPLDHDMIFQFISTTSGKMWTMASLRKRLQQLSRAEILGDSHGEIADLVIKEMQQYGEMRFSAGSFWQYRGSHWEKIENHEILTLIIHDYGTLHAGRRSSDHVGVLKTMQSLLAKDLRLSHVRGLNFANGFLTSDLKLMPHSPDFGVNYVLPFVYNPDKAGACPRFLSFLNQSWGADEDYIDKVQALREAIAVTLFGMAGPFQKAFCALGVPHSGKSVLLDIIRGVLPPEATCSVKPDDWNDKFLPTQMLGRLVNFCGELSEHSVIPGDRFKYIVDGGEIPGQYKGGQIFHFTPYCAHWFASNHIPRTRDSSAGFTRRWQFFHFTHAVRAEDKIVGLGLDIAAEERDAIVAWAVTVMPELMRKQDFTTPRSHITQIEEMAGLNNSVRFFFKGSKVKIVPGSSNTGASISELSLHSAYWNFCRTQANAKPVSLKIFRQRAQEMKQELGFEIQLEAESDKATYSNIILAEESGTLH